MISALLLLLSCDESPPVEPAAEEAGDGLIDVGAISDLLAAAEPVPVPVDRLDDYEEALWQRFRQERAAERKAAYETRALTSGEKTMRFTVETIGDRPRDGYPVYIALHGGGGAAAEVNDQQWESMQGYYRDSIKAGLYVVPRGVTNEWNLHFDDASYALYDRLIEDLILLEEVDADRVYLLGFSAGGDGVYQIAPRMADRFAAVSMSAGHDNGVSPANLYRLPILLQMGELDEAHGRNKAVVAFSEKLDALHAEHPEGYAHDLFVHLDGEHNAPWSDHDPTGKPMTVLADPSAWAASGDRSTKLQDSNAVGWLSRHIRAAQPDRVIWDRTTIPPGDEGPWYWLEAESGEQIDVEINRRENAIVIHSAGDHLRLLLNHRIIDLRRPITIQSGEQSLTLDPEPDLRNMAKILDKRGDPRMISSVVIDLERSGGAWKPR